MDTSALSFLFSFAEEILSLYACLHPATHQAECSQPLVFLKVALQLKFVVSPSPTDLDACACPLLMLSTKAQTGNWPHSGGKGHSTQGMGWPWVCWEDLRQGAFPAASGKAFWWESTTQLVEMCTWALTHTLSLFCTKRIVSWGSSLLLLCCSTLAKVWCV